jgi:flavorubredoxin
MPSLTLYDDGSHRNLLLEDFGHGQMVQANQHLVIHGRAGMILDPGGHKVYTRALAETSALLGRATLQYVFLSHQDPDIVAALNGWLMTTDATAFASSLWLRFIPHFGLDSLVIDRLRPVPDEGMRIDLAGAELLVLPAHFLHSPGNFSVYDPVSRILYSGDLGASLGMDYREVADFGAHLKYMEGFHRRYMASRKAARAWVRMVRTLDVETIAPQHGALFRGKEMAGRFLDWLFELDCGVDLMPERYLVPAR